MGVRRQSLAERGMTLLEIVVVLAVLAMLAALLTPMVLTYVEDARKSQAQNDAAMIGTAIAAFMKDTGLPPYKNNTTTGKTPAFETGDSPACTARPATSSPRPRTRRPATPGPAARSTARRPARAGTPSKTT